jgi:hydrogenase maturation protease
MTARVLVAGLGNIFLGDDAFGVEVARRLGGPMLGGAVEVKDFGTRALDLAYALQGGYDAVVLVDATRQGGAPGTLYVLEPDAPDAAAVLDAHGVTPAQVLGLARALGRCPPARVVGCEPASLEPAAGLSPAVEAAVGPAAELVRRVAGELLARGEGEP